MSGIMTANNWAKYITAINNYSDSVSNQVVTWRHKIGDVSRWQEGADLETEDILMDGLVAYNTFRTWPVDIRSEPGILDKEYCHVYLNVKYLSDNGWLNSDGLFAFDPEFDRFIINGLEYKPAGDTQAAQANILPTFQIVILEREETKTGLQPRQ